jgi:hypothetical protein
MEGFVFFVEQIAPALYILCALGIVLGIRSYYLARQSLAGAQFELEKELSRYHAENALTVIMALIEVGLAVVALAQVVAPTLRAQPPQSALSIPGPRETPFVTAIPSPMSYSGTPAPSFAEGAEIPALEDELNLQPFATPTLTPTPVGTIIPDVPPALGCDTPDAQLVIPANGMVVFEAISVVGTANTDNFAFYRFELNGPSTNNSPAKLSEYTVPVVNGELGQIVPSLLIPGEHRFRLTVFDITNTLRAFCEITIIISEPIPTPTPIRES